MKTFTYCPMCAGQLTQQLVDGETRSACPAAGCGFVYYDNPTPVVAAIVEHEGAVVLAHNRAWPQKLYAPITGFLERGEASDQCVVREVKEELNLDSEAPTLIGVYPFERMNQVIIAYHVRASGAIKLNDELDDYKHVPFDQCRAWGTATGLALRDWLRSRGYEPEMVPLKPAGVL